MVEAGVAARFGAVPHWAKAEIPAHPGAASCILSQGDTVCVPCHQGE